MRRFIFIITSIFTVIMGLFSIIMIRTLLFRNSLPYNSEGRYFDPSQGIVYHDQSIILVWLLMIISIIIFVVFLASALLIRRSIHFKKRVSDAEKQCIQIIVNRSSVCMGDDIEDHSRIYDVDRSFESIDLFNHINNSSYLPSIDGNDVEWCMDIDGIEAIVYRTLKNEVINVDAEERVLSEGTRVFFRYHSSVS